MFSGCARDVLRVALGVADRACADGPEGGGCAGLRCRISFGLRGLRGICIPSTESSTETQSSTQSLSNFFSWKSFQKLFIFLCEVFRA